MRGQIGRTAVVAAVLATLLAGCSGGDDTPAPDDATASPGPTPTGDTLALDADELDEGDDGVAELEDEGLEVDEDPSAAGEFDAVAFCAAAAPAITTTDPDLIGTDDHIALFDAALASAPADVLDPLQQVRDHYDLVVDPTDPRTQDPSTFPPFLQSARQQVQAAVDQHC